METPTVRPTVRGDIEVAYLGHTVDAMIAEFMQQHDIPGLTLAIVQAPYIPRVVGYGFADPEQKRLASTRTIWPVGPISQAYAGVAVMQLYEAGQLRLDARITDLLPDLPPAWSGVTVLHLLRHSAGLPDYRNHPDFDPARAGWTARELIDLARDTPPSFAPDTDAAVSATHFLLLAEIIERVSGQSYHDFVTERQISFLGLQHTCFSEDLARLHEEDVAAANNLHTRFKSEKIFVNPAEHATGHDAAGRPVPRPESAAFKGFADIWASAEDVSYWDICLAGSILVTRPENRDLLYKPFALLDGRRVPAMSGWNFYHHRGLMDIKGSVPGFSAFLSRFTDASELVCVTLLANREGVDFTWLARRIAAAFGSAMAPAHDTDRICLCECSDDADRVMQRVEDELSRRRIPVFARFDHARNAHEADLKLPPTRVIVFGAPAVGTRLMLKDQSLALDLPLRIAVWEDAGGVWLAFPRLDRLAPALAGDPTLRAMRDLLEALAAKASVAL